MKNDQSGIFLYACQIFLEIGDSSSTQCVQENKECVLGNASPNRRLEFCDIFLYRFFIKSSSPSGQRHLDFNHCLVGWWDQVISDRLFVTVMVNYNNVCSSCSGPFFHSHISWPLDIAFGMNTPFRSNRVCYCSLSQVAAQGPLHVSFIPIIYSAVFVV